MVETPTLVGMKRREQNSSNRSGIKPPKPGKHILSIPTVSENVSFYNWKKNALMENLDPRMLHIYNND